MKEPYQKTADQIVILTLEYAQRLIDECTTVEQAKSRLEGAVALYKHNAEETHV